MNITTHCLFQVTDTSFEVFEVGEDLWWGTFDGVFPEGAEDTSSTTVCHGETLGGGRVRKEERRVLVVRLRSRREGC